MGRRDYVYGYQDTDEIESNNNSNNNNDDDGVYVCDEKNVREMRQTNLLLSLLQQQHRKELPVVNMDHSQSSFSSSSSSSKPSSPLQPKRHAISKPIVISLQQQQQHQIEIISLIQQYPKYFIHFMEQSNDRNQNWDIIVSFLQQLSIPMSTTGCTTSTSDNDSNDHPSLLMTFLSQTILSTKRGWTFLHWLCSHGGTPIHVLEALVKPFTTTTTNNSDDNSTERRTFITQLIVQPDTYGNTSLHLLCRKACKFSSKKLQLFLSALWNSDHDTNDHDQRPNAILIRNILGGTVLHAATIGAAVYDVLVTIVSIHPKVSQISSKNGVYPVTALWYSYYDRTNSGYGAIWYLSDYFDVKHDPSNYEDDRLKSQGEEFQQFWEKVEYLAVQYFLLSENCPKHLKKESNNSDTNINNERRKYILHGLLQCDAPIKMIKVCLHVYPISATAVDRYGNTPLHILIQNRPYHCCSNKPAWFQQLEKESAIELCFLAYRTAASMVNHQQHLPLQLAIFNNIRIGSKIYDKLLEAAPHSIHYRYCTTTRSSIVKELEEDVNADDDCTGFYPYQLAAIQSDTSLQSIYTIYFLLRKQPSLLHRK